MTDRRSSQQLPFFHPTYNVQVQKHRGVPCDVKTTCHEASIASHSSNQNYTKTQRMSKIPNKAYIVEEITSTLEFFIGQIKQDILNCCFLRAKPFREVHSFW